MRGVKKRFLYVLTLLLIFGTAVPLRTAAASTQADAEKEAGTALRICKAVIGKYTDEILSAAADRVHKMRREMEDPGRGDLVISRSGKILRRSQGKWVTLREEKNSGEDLTIVFTGDVIFDRGQNPGAAIAWSDGIRACFDDDSWNIMQDADFLVVNNEFQYTDRGSPIPNKKFTFRCPPETAEWLAEMGTDLAALANNHIYDYGEEGLLDTFDTLDEAGIPYFGAGHDIEEAQKPVYLIFDGMIVALLNATEIERYENSETRGAQEESAGVFRCLDDEDLCEKVREAKEHADLCIAFVHWGTELMPAAEQSQIDKAQDLAEAGADLIVGAHPHILQNISYENSVPVFYSLGNYFFSASTRDSGVLRVTVDPGEASIKSLQFIPMQQRQGVAMLYDEEKERVLDTMRELSPGVDIDENGFFTEE